MDSDYNKAVASYCAAAVLVLIGCIQIWVVLKPYRFGDMPSEGTLFAMWLCGGTMIGAGVAAPFNHPFIGAACGLAVQLFLTFVALSMLRQGLGGL